MATIATLIVDVVANTAKLQGDVEKIHGSLDKVGSIAGRLGGVLAGAFSIGAVVSFATSVFDSASKTKDLSDQLGISTDAVQGFKFAAEQSGSSIDAVAGAITRMNKNLVDGDKGTVNALKAAGLNFHEIRAMKPEDAFLAIADGIKDIEDPMVQSNVALTIFGKSAAELLPGMKEGFRGLSDGANKMSSDTIKSLEAAQDAWGKLSDQVTIVSGNLIGHALNTASTVTSSWRSFAMYAENIIKFGAGAATAMADQQGTAEKAVKAHLEVQKTAPPILAKTREETDAAAKAAEAHAKAIQGITDKLTGAGAIRAANDMVEALRDLGPLHLMTKDAQVEVAKTMEGAIEVYKAAGRDIPAQWKLIALAARAESKTMSEDTKREMTETSTALAKPFKGFELHVAEMRLPARDLSTIVSAPFVDAGKNLSTLEGSLRAHGIVTKAELEATAATAKAQFDFMRESGLYTYEQVAEAGKRAAEAQKVAIGETASAWSLMKDSLGQVLGNIPQTLADAFAGGGDIMGAVKSIASQIGSKVGGGIGFAIGGPLGQKVGEAVGSLAGPLVGMFQKMFSNAGREAVVAFAESLGGFDPMHQKLLTLGAAGEALWVKLTQGVGRNNPEQAKKVIEEINLALAGQDAWMGRLPGLIEKYGLAWENAGLQAKQAHLDEIARGLIQDFADLTKAGFSVEDVTKGMTTAINDYISQAIRTGTEIPAAMKPLLQKMIDMGVLTDDAGLAITDLGSLKFSESLTEGFRSVVEAIKQLTLALTGDLGGALDALGRRRLVIPIDFEMPDDPTGGAEKFHSGTARVLPFYAHNGLLPDEVPAILQTGEAVLNRRAAAAVGTQTIGALNRGDRPSSGHDARVDELRKELAAQRASSDANFERLLQLLPKLAKAAAQQGRAA